MFEELFSRRHSLRPTPEGLMEETVQNSARIGLDYILDELYSKGWTSPDEVYRSMCVTLRIPRKDRDRVYATIQDLNTHIDGLIENVEWWEFYDICELIFGILNERSEYYATGYVKRLNSLFIDEGIPFKLAKGKIEKVGSGFIDAKVKEARYLLKEPEFKGADEHFEKAIKALNERPKPDVENCVKDAVAAIESVGRIIVGNEKALLDDIIKDMAKKSIIPKPLDQAIQKIYAYRGDQPGVAHGLVGTSKVTIDEAEFVLAMSAATIIYLVKKRK